jgi:hypothetical protein
MSIKFPARTATLQQPLLPKAQQRAPAVKPPAAPAAKPSSESGMLPSQRKPLVDLGQTWGAVPNNKLPTMSLRDLQLSQRSGGGQLGWEAPTSSDTSAVLSEGGFEAEHSTGREFGPLKARVTNAFAVEKSEPRPTPEGPEQVTLTVEAEVSASTGFEVSPGNWTYEAEKTTGVREKYQVMGSPEAINAIEASGQMPDPLNPETIPEGVTVLLTSESFSGQGEAVGYGPLRNELGYSESEGMAFSAQNLGGGTMRVTAGPTQAVQTEAFLGVEAGPARFGLTSESEERASNMVSADFNTNTPEGKRAYRDFMRTGEVPQENPPHVTNVRTIVQGDASAVTGGEASLAGVGFSVEGMDMEAQTRISTDPVTQQQELEQYIRNGDTAGHMAVSRDAEGKPTGEATYTFMIEDVDSESARLALYADSGNPDVSAEGNQNIQLKMTEQELMELHDSSLIAVGQNMDPPMTDPREVEAWISEHPDEPALLTADPLVQGIATAESPEEVATAIVRHGDNGAEVTQTLKDLYEATGIQTPGELTAAPSGG